MKKKKKTRSGQKNIRHTVPQASPVESDNAKALSIGVRSTDTSRDLSGPHLRNFVSSRKTDASTNAGTLASRRGSDEDEDGFLQYYGNNSLLVQPQFPPEWLWKCYRECDTLNLCVEAEVDNCVNIADLAWEGTKGEENTDDAKRDRTALSDLFKRVNEKESLYDLRRKIRRDRSVTRLGYVEVIRDSTLEPISGTSQFQVNPKPNRFYHIPSTHMRVTYLGPEEIPVTVQLPRNGKLVQVTIKQRFRRFARRNPRTNELTWFKEFGDPRTIDAKIGNFMKWTLDDQGKIVDTEKTDNPGTEIWWFRDAIAGEVYGVPRWISVIWDITGRYQAKWINFDHLDQGAIPPGFFTTSGGKLSTNSKNEFNKILQEIRDPQFFNRFFFLEMDPDINYDLNGGAGSKLPKIEYHKLRDPQHEDLMNKDYLGGTKEDIRQVFRIPPVLTGIAGNDTFASAYVSMEVAESQVFQPAKDSDDAKWTAELIQNELGIYNWKLRTRPGKIGDKETFYKAVGAMSRAGALTINDVRELSNQLLGTSFAPFKGQVYDEPKTLVDALASLGMVKYDEASKSLVFSEPVQKALEIASSNGVKSDAHPPEMEHLAQQLIDVLGEIEKLQANYQAPEIDEHDYIL